MIVDPPALVIRRDFARPDAATRAAFAGAAIGHVADALGGRGGLGRRIKPMVPLASPMVGVAVTCACGPSDNLALFGALAVARPGDVLVAATEGFEHAAVTGDLLLGMARNKGIAGFVTDGLVRDLAGIRAVGLPAFAAGVTPNSPARCGPGAVGTPVVLGGVAVEAGDIVVGDEDGVVVPLARDAAETAAALARVRTAEAALEAQVRAGLTLPDFVEAVLASGRVVDLP